MVCFDRYTGEIIDENSRYNSVLSWTDIVAINAGDTQIVGLRSDGTVVAAGSDKNDQLNVGDWENIVAVSAGQFFTLGLMEDGTVISTIPEELRADEDSGYKDLFVDDWDHIIAISAGDWTIAGLKEDGTVIFTVTNFHYNSKPLSEISSWTDIIAVTAGLYEVMALRADGTLLVAGGREFDEFSKLKLW